MAHLDDLISQVDDTTLRTEMQAALSALKKRQRFGLVYEDHLPERTVLAGLPVKVGAFVQKKDDKTGQTYSVRSIEGTTAMVEAGEGEAEEIEVDDLFVAKRFGEAIYPALTPLGHIHNGEDDRPHHAVINAENYHALQLLLYLYEGKADCIYIDPPYNTGARDWKYNNDYVDSNDAWRHSKWLSMMERRLRLAKRLLRPDGVLIVTIDENEHAHLVSLLEALFPEYDITSISIVHNPRGVQGDNFSYTHEYAVYVIPQGSKLIGRRRLTADEIKSNSATLRNWGGSPNGSTARQPSTPSMSSLERSSPLATCLTSLSTRTPQTLSPVTEPRPFGP